jgi:hypothetical protein
LAAFSEIAQQPLGSLEASANSQISSPPFSESQPVSNDPGFSASGELLDYHRLALQLAVQRSVSSKHEEAMCLLKNVLLKDIGGIEQAAMTPRGATQLARMRAWLHRMIWGIPRR